MNSFCVVADQRRSNGPPFLFSATNDNRYDESMLSLAFEVLETWPSTHLIMLDSLKLECGREALAKN
jgi:hypothetical protein